MPITSLFSKNKEIDINIHKPTFVLEEDIFKLMRDLQKKTKTPGRKSAVKLNRLNIKHGELLYRSERITVELLDFDLESSIKQLNKMVYRLKSPHLKVVLPFKGKEVRFEGDVESLFRQDQDGWRINRFLWNTKHVTVEMNGRILKDNKVALNAVVRGSPRQVLDPLLGRLSIRDFIYSNVKIRKDKDAPLTISGRFTANNFSIAGENFDNLRGNIKWDNIGKRIKVDAFFDDKFYNSSLKVDSGKGLTLVQMKNVSGEKSAKIINIYDTTPLAGIVKDSDFKIEKGVISGKAELDQEKSMGQEGFNLKGIVNFSYHSKKKAVKFISNECYSEFGKVFIEGVIDPGKKERISIRTMADLYDTGGLARYSMFYLNLDLSPWNLEKGRGRIDLEVKKIDRNLVVKSDLNIRDFFSSKQEVRFLNGRVASQHGITSGTFSVQDKDLDAKVDLYVDEENVRMKFKEIRGESQKILKILGFDVSLWGAVQGDFSYDHKEGDAYPHVLGDFRAKRLNFYGFDFDNMKGKLEAREFLALKNLDYFYKDGKGDADILINYGDKTFRLNGQIRDFDINKMNQEFKGKGDLSFEGAGAFNTDPINVDFRSGEVSFYQDRKFAVKGQAKIFTDFSNYRLQAEGDVVNQTIPSPFTIELNQEEGKYTGSFNLSLRDINLLIPWGNNLGEVELKGQISSNQREEISTQGYATFKGKILSFPNFPHAIRDFEGDLIFKDLDFTLRSLRGKMGGGDVETDGRLVIRENKLVSLSINFSGKDMLLYPMDRTSCQVDARDLTINYVEGKLLLKGELVFSSGSWEREIDEAISFNTDPSLSPSGSTILDLLQYDLKLIGKKGIQVDNSLLKANAQVDLRLTGSPEFPILTGLIESRNGHLLIAGNKFELIKARLRFNNRFHNDPLIDVESELFLKNYRIRFTTKGTYSRLRPEFQSSPPLPPRDILTLLSLGELFERPTTSELSSQIGEGTTGLIAAEITDEITKRTKKIFGDYLLKIDPNITNITGASVEETSRVIIGKSIAKNFLIVYSTNFSTQRQQVLYFQYQLAPSISLIGMRNEEGRFSIDIRFRKKH